MLSQIENDIVPPTLATLLNIARELEVNVDHFFMQQKAFEKVELTRAHERLKVAKSRDTDQARMTYNCQALAYRLKDKRMEPFLVEFDSGIDENRSLCPTREKNSVTALKGKLNSSLTKRGSSCSLVMRCTTFPKSLTF